MVFARFLFPHQVSKRLYSMGWKKRDMPTRVMISDLCRALQISGYNAETAATLWNRCLRYEPEAIEQLKRDTGLYGVLHLSQFFGNPDEGVDTDKPRKSRRAGTSKKAKK